MTAPRPRNTPPRESVRKRVLAASLALSAYAAGACATTPPEPYNQAADTEKLDYPRPATIEDADDYTIDLHAGRARATRSASRPRPAPRPETSGAAAGGDTLNVVSTAYCLTGVMANGQRTYFGAVAMNGVPMGSKWQTENGSIYVVSDRIGHGSQFDIAMPGDCAAARAYGRRTITIRRVA